MTDYVKRNWWKQVLIGLLAIAFGISVVVFPARLMFGSILDAIFGDAKPASGGMTAVATLLALVALVAVDGVVNLFGNGTIDKGGARLRGVIGVATAIAAIVWPGRTAFIAVELIGLWAIAIGALELGFAKYGGKDKKNRPLLIAAAIASILMGVGIMRWVFAGAVVISAMVGIAAMARGFSLIMSGISERSYRDDGAPLRA